MIQNGSRSRFQYNSEANRLAAPAHRRFVGVKRTVALQKERLGIMYKTFVYIGSWWASDGPTAGISVYEFNSDTGTLTLLKRVCEELSVGALWMDRSNRRLFASDEVENNPLFRKGGGGQIVEFAADAETGDLTEICRVPSFGSNPCSLVTDPSGRYLLAANHGGRAAATYTETDEDGQISIRIRKAESSIVLVPVSGEGAIGRPCDILRLSGEGPGPNQYGPHAHSIRRSPDGTLYAVCNQGADRLIMLKLDAEHGKLIKCGDSPFECAPGSHPRYSIFHPELPYLYVDKETTPMVSAFRFDPEGRLTRAGSFMSVPEDTELPSGFIQTDLCINNEGTRLYVLLRQLNVLRVFGIDKETGALSPLQLVTGIPDYARACAMSPDGRFLLTASYRAGAVVSYPVLNDGTLGEAVSRTEQPLAGAIAFYSAR